MKQDPLHATLCTLAAGLALAGPALAAGADTPPASQAVAIRFALQAGDLPVGCQGAPVRLGGTGTAVRLRDARFYLHDLALLDAQGRKVPVQLQANEWQTHGVALVDLEDGSGGKDGCDGGTTGTHAVVTGSVPAGRYSGLSWVVGVPVTGTGPAGEAVSLNHSSHLQAPAPLDVAAMGWSWQAGRKFMKVEVLPEGGIARSNGTSKVWTFHLGSGNCKGNPATGETVRCGQPNRPEVQLQGFDPGTDVVVLDLAGLYAGADLGRDEGGASGCMSGVGDPECKPLFDNLGLQLGDSAPGRGDGGLPRPGTVQRVFRAVRGS